MARSIRVAVVLAVLLALSGPVAYAQYVDHRTYRPPSGEDPVDFGRRLTPGTPVAEKPGYVWRHDGRGWYWDLAPTTQTPGPWPQPPAGDDDCDRHVNPYVEPDLAAECMRRRLAEEAPPALPVYVVGRQYLDGGYPSLRMVVIAVTRSLDGVDVVTFQWLVDTGNGRKVGDVEACRNDEGRSETSCRPWVPRS